MVDAGLVVLTEERTAELRAVVNSRDVSAATATRARIVLWMAEGKRRKDDGELAGVSLPTVDRWVRRYAADGLTCLEELQRGEPHEQITTYGRSSRARSSCRRLSSPRGEGTRRGWPVPGSSRRGRGALVRREDPDAGPPQNPAVAADRLRNTDAKSFVWTATADEILAKVRWVQTNIKQLVANNSK